MYTEDGFTRANGGVAAEAASMLAALKAEVCSDITTAQKVFKLIECLLRLAEAGVEVNVGTDSEQGQEHGHGARTCADGMLHALYLSLDTSLLETSDVDSCFVGYALHRALGHLRSLRPGFTVRSPEQPASVVRWEILGSLMFKIVDYRLEREDTMNESRLGRLHLSPGFLALMELVCRNLFQEREPSFGGEYADKLVTSIAGSLFLVGTVLGTTHELGHGRGRARKTTIFSSRLFTVCTSYLGTILKLFLLLERHLGPLGSTVSLLVVERMVESTRCLVALNCFIVGVIGDNQPGDRCVPVFTTMEFLVKKSLIVLHRLRGIPAVTANQRATSVGVSWPYSPVMASKWASRITELAQVSAHGFLGCHYPNCMTMLGSSENAMKTLLCSGCRRVRYCSSECQRADRTEHVLCRVLVPGFSRPGRAPTISRRPSKK